MNRPAFIRIATEYINYNTISRISVNRLGSVETPWRVNVHLSETHADGLMVFGSGTIGQRNNSFYWSFKTQEDAHAFAQKILGDRLDKSL